MLNNSEEPFTKGMSHWNDKDDESLSNYTIWQANLITPYLGKRVLEIGAGWGRFTLLLNSMLYFEKYIALEPSKFIYATLCKKCPDVEILNITIEELESTYDNTFDTILLIHVLEHVEDDVKFLLEINRLLIPGGKIIIMVPAINFLMSDLDRNIGHYRRYNKKRIKFLSQKLGYKVLINHYDNFIGLPGWFWYCKIKKVHYQSYNKKKNLLKIFKFFDNFVLPIFSRLENYLPPPIGLNLTTVLQKSEY